MANIAHATICIVWLLVVVVTHNSIVVRSPQTTIPSSQLKGHRLQKVIVFKTLQNSKNSDVKKNIVTFFQTPYKKSKLNYLDFLSFQTLGFWFLHS